MAHTKSSWFAVYFPVSSGDGFQRQMFPFPWVLGYPRASVTATDSPTKSDQFYGETIAACHWQTATLLTKIHLGYNISEATTQKKFMILASLVFFSDRVEINVSTSSAVLLLCHADPLRTLSFCCRFLLTVIYSNINFIISSSPLG